jgi:type VI secretion system secreted protein Hcp
MANSMYLNIEGAKGTCLESKHKEWIEIESYSFGGSQASTQSYGSGAGAGKVSFQDFHFTVKAGKESPVLFGFMCSGQHIGKIELHESKAGGKDPVNFVEVILTDCFVTSYQMSDSSGSPEPTCSYSINFNTAKFKYQAQNDKGAKEGGPIEAGWDAKQNKAL